MNYADEAVKIITGDRHESYGHPGDDLGGIAMMWSGLLNTRLTQPLSGKDVALMMTGLKLVRHAHKAKDDNLIDAHGYLICAEWIETGVRPVSEAQAAKAMVETVCTGERLQCGSCGQSMPCMCEHKIQCMSEHKP